VVGGPPGLLLTGQPRIPDCLCLEQPTEVDLVRSQFFHPPDPGRPHLDEPHEEPQPAPPRLNRPRLCDWPPEAETALDQVISDESDVFVVVLQTTEQTLVQQEEGIGVQARWCGGREEIRCEVDEGVDSYLPPGL
jgi:hypothetical protein